MKKAKDKHKENVKARDKDPSTTRKRYIRELNNKVLDYSKLKSETITKYNIQYDKSKDLFYEVYLRGRPTGIFGCSLLNFLLLIIWVCLIGLEGK